jgi:hypothetical protein
MDPMSPAECELQQVLARMAELRRKIEQAEIEDAETDCHLEHGEDDFYFDSESRRSRSDFVSAEDEIWKDVKGY